MIVSFGIVRAWLGCHGSYPDSDQRGGFWDGDRLPRWLRCTRLHLGSASSSGPPQLLTCLELVGVFSIALRPGVDRETACALVMSLREHGAGLDAVYGSDPDRPQPPTFPNVIPLRAA
jgi:hypothetical protein